MVESSDTIPLDEEVKTPRESDVLEDVDIYTQEKPTQDIFTDDIEFEFSCRNPQDRGGHIEYEVRGRDEQGLFECNRRFNDFFALHEQLTKRWPGCLIPPIPAKKLSNKDLIFIQERRYYLERFLRKLSKSPYIINGPEFQLFARPMGPEVAKSLSKLPPMQPQELYERMVKATGINE